MRWDPLFMCFSGRAHTPYWSLRNHWTLHSAGCTPCDGVCRLVAWSHSQLAQVGSTETATDASGLTTDVCAETRAGEAAI